jgi:hypothetical protein
MAVPPVSVLLVARHRLTERGALLTTALFAAREANVEQLLAKAA